MTRIVLGPPDPSTPMISGAILSGCRTFRYLLWRIWDLEAPRLGFVMVNPSSADETAPDPTITRCMGFAQLWGFGGIVVANLFAFRTPYIEALRDAGCPVGPDNDDAIRAACWATSRMLMAWGEHKKIQSRLNLRLCTVRRLLRDEAPEVGHLGRNGHGKGQPRHPLYMPSTTPFCPESPA